MAQLVLIGLGAGAATALLFASIVSGAPIAVLLLYLAPLPVLIAALGFSHWAALIAVVTATLGLAAAFDGYRFVVFLVAIGLPAWWLGYLALLARPAAGPATGVLEWYPVGNLVLWVALIAALLVIGATLLIGTDEASFRGAMRQGLEQMLKLEDPMPGAPTLPLREPNRLIDFLVVALPPTAAVVTTIVSLVNLWLAARIVAVSGRLRRPMPELSALRFPRAAPALLAIAIGASFLPGMIGIAGGVLGAATLVAFAVLGLAVMHATTRAVKGRMLMLSATYAAVIVFGWPILALSLVGLADTAFDFRNRLSRRRGPPATRT
jgi:hypothetical protein